MNNNIILFDAVEDNIYECFGIHHSNNDGLIYGINWFHNIGGELVHNNESIINILEQVGIPARLRRRRGYDSRHICLINEEELNYLKVVIPPSQKDPSESPDIWIDNIISIIVGTAKLI